MIYIEHQKFLEEIKKKQRNYKLMALDIGQKKIGLATAFSILKVATPYKILTRSTPTKDIANLSKEIKDNSISALIIGLPISNQGEHTNNTNTILNFVNKFQESFDIPITFYDERMTTKLANNLLKEIHLSRKMRNKIDDQVAASIILADFLKLNQNFL